MKRSDMVTQLVQLLVLCKNNDLGYTETAEEILSLVEDRGMKPPPIETSDYPWYTSDRPEGYIPTITVWEEEYEKI